MKLRDTEVPHVHQTGGVIDDESQGETITRKQNFSVVVLHGSFTRGHLSQNGGGSPAMSCRCDSATPEKKTTAINSHRHWSLQVKKYISES